MYHLRVSSLLQQSTKVPQRFFSVAKSSAATATTTTTPPPATATEKEPPKLKPLLASANEYQRHIFVGSGIASQWPKNAKDTSPLIEQLWTIFKDTQELKPNQLTLFESRDKKENGSVEVFVFPEHVKLKLNEANVNDFVADVKEGNIGKRLEKGYLNTIHVFVCCHASHDNRCGECGGPIYQEFQKAIQAASLKDKISVHRCSHIGGHKFAGNVIVFNKGNGDWYGNLKSSHVPIILNNIQKGEIAYDFWRGRMGLTKDQVEKMFQERF